MSMIDSACTEERAVYGVRYEDPELMLKWLAPPLASAFWHLIAKRAGSANRDLDADEACAARRTRADGQAWDASQRRRKQNGGF